MGEVIQFGNFSKPSGSVEAGNVQDSLVPIEFAVGFASRNECLNKIAEYGVSAVHVRMVNDEPDAMLYLIGVRDAILLNKKILEGESITDDEVAQRIDLIQMLENLNLDMLDSLWASFTHQGKFWNR